jgi:hypothetical protein
LNIIVNSEPLLVFGEGLSKKGIFSLDAISLDLEICYGGLLSLTRFVGGSSVSENTLVLSLLLLFCRLCSFARRKNLFDLGNRLAPCFALFLGRLRCRLAVNFFC